MLCRFCTNDAPYAHEPTPGYKVYMCISCHHKAMDEAETVTQFFRNIQRMMKIHGAKIHARRSREVELRKQEYRGKGGPNS